MTVAGEIAYYLRPVNGDDSNDGQSFATAWKTWPKCMELCGTTGATADNAILFLVNEGGAYTGPYHSGPGESSAVDYYFSTYGSNYIFQICGLSADGSYDPKTNFEFDLSGFTGQNWLYAAFNSAQSDKGILFRNITWKNATTATKSILNASYDDDISYSKFLNCSFEDNELNEAIFAIGSYGTRNTFENCRIIRNNTYATAHSMFSTYSTTGSPRGNLSVFRNCVFDSNQTDASSSNYVTGYAASFDDGVDFLNCVFYNNGYDENTICVLAEGSYQYAEHRVANCIFFNNSGTAVQISNSYYNDAKYGYSNYASRLVENVFAYNNKSIDFQTNEPGLRFSALVNNVFYNNTVEDIPDLMETLPGVSGGNYVFDPEFNNGYSGDFSVPHDSRLFSYSMVDGVPIGGSHVQRRLFTTTTSGSLSLGTGDVGDTVTVSGKSYQKVNQNPPVWRRFITQPPLTSTFSPSSLSSLYAWYDASTDVVTNGSDVTQWTDKSGNGYHMSAAGPPVLTSSGQNGLNVITMSEGDNMSMGNTGPSDFNMIWVGKPSRVRWMLATGGSGNGWLFLGEQNSTSTFGTFVRDVSNSSVTKYLNGSLETAWYDWGDVHASMNDNWNILQVGWGGSLPSSGWDDFKIGIYSPSTNYQYAGDVGELIILDTPPTDSERRKIEGYLAHKWGLASKLPSDHPFKNYAP